MYQTPNSALIFLNRSSFFFMVCSIKKKYFNKPFYILYRMRRERGNLKKKIVEILLLFYSFLLYINFSITYSYPIKELF